MRKTFTTRLAVRVAVAATALAAVAVLAQPHDASHGSSAISGATDVARQRWGLSNPRLREYAVRHVTPPVTRPTSGPSGTPSSAPSSGAPTGTAPSSQVPSTTDSGSGTPSTDAPTSDLPGTGVPSSDAPGSDTPTSDAPTSDLPGTGVASSDAPSSDTPTSDVPTSAASSPGAPATDTPGTSGAGSVGSSTPAPSPSSSDTVISANTAMPAGDLPGWKLTYADDFNGTSLNSRAWSVYGNNTIPSEPDSGYWGISHATVGNGMLTLRGERDYTLSPEGRIVTAGVGLWNLAPQTYGKYEALVRMDSCDQVKYAWLLWPYSGKWPGDGEIDWAEDGGGNRTTTTGTVIYAGSDGNRAMLPQNRVSPLVPMSGWHVVGVEWTPGKVVYTMDGVPWGTVNSSHVPSGPMTMIMQTEAVTPAAQVPSNFSSCNAQVAWVAQWAMK